MSSSADEPRSIEQVVEALLRIAQHYFRELQYSLNNAPEDIVNSAFRSAIEKDDCPPIDDPSLYEFLKPHFERKLDTARHAYRTARGKTVAFSQLESRDDQSGGIEAQIAAAIDLLIGVDINQSLDDDKTPVEKQVAIERFHAWLMQIPNVCPTDTHRTVLELWLHGKTLEAISQQLKLTYNTVQRLRREIIAAIEQWLEGEYPA